MELAIRQLAASAIAVEDVLDIYEAAGIQRPGLSHLDQSSSQTARAPAPEPGHRGALPRLRRDRRAGTGDPSRRCLLGHLPRLRFQMGA
ncbi:type I restriction enzyme endonuclease domain-containing protein [Catellatospora aurea]|uniref:Type I restriction enzyme endonuclease domain-containing protein n=1 Tax=Catellatospora aurea TaxID=1337874 RepID=A0ABW2H1Y0_9ACTN